MCTSIIAHLTIRNLDCFYFRIIFLFFAIDEQMFVMVFQANGTQTYFVINLTCDWCEVRSKNFLVLRPTIVSSTELSSSASAP